MLRPSRVLVVAAFFVTLITTAHAALKGSPRKVCDKHCPHVVRTDGLYWTEVEAGTRFLRFYPDGTVLEVCYTHTAAEVKADPSELLRHFGRIHPPMVSEGTYKQCHESIKFEVTSDQGSVDYTGCVCKDGMRLSWSSKINGVHDINAWQFQQLDLNGW